MSNRREPAACTAETGMSSLYVGPRQQCCYCQVWEELTCHWVVVDGDKFECTHPHATVIGAAKAFAKAIKA